MPDPSSDDDEKDSQEYLEKWAASNKELQQQTAWFEAVEQPHLISSTLQASQEA
jgi:hypothetical protein